nr:hypothetical protein [Nocardioidaceae bacterium]
MTTTPGQPGQQPGQQPEEQPGQQPGEQSGQPAQPTQADWTQQLPPTEPGPVGPWPAPPEGQGAQPAHPERDESVPPVTPQAREQASPPREPLLGSLLAAVGLLGAGIGVGTGLVAASLFPRPNLSAAAAIDRDFNWPAFVVVLGVIIALVLLTVAGRLLLLTESRAARAFTGGAAGLAAGNLGILVGLLLDDADATGYLVGLTIAAAGAAAYVWLRSAPPIAAVVIGGLVMAGTLLGDTVSSEDDAGLAVGIGLVVYGVAVAAAGWLLPTRHTSAMLGGIIALAGAQLVIVLGLVSQFVGDIAAGMSGEQAPPGADPTLDVAVAMVLGLLVCAGLLALFAWTRFTGYAVLGVLGTVLLGWSGIFGLDLDSPLRWSAGIGAVALI